VIACHERDAARGNALPETALVMPLLMFMMWGLIQVALTAYYQLSADGASFMGAQKSVAVNGAAASLSTARTIATSIFSHVPSAAVGVATPGPTSTASAVFETNVTQTIGNIGVPGFPSSQSITSRTIEAGVGSSTSLGPISFCSKATSGPAAFSLANTVNSPGASAIVNNTTGAINASALTAHATDLQSVSTGLGGIESSLTQISTVLSQVGSLPGGGLLVQGVLNAVLSATQPVLNGALAGTASSSSISGLGTSLNTILTPIEQSLAAIGQSALANQLVAAVTSLVNSLSTLNGAESDLKLLTGAVC
jgi:hypothetical protein